MWITYDEESKRFRGLISQNARPGDVPMAFEPLVRKGVRTFTHEQVMPWVEERIVPRNRQNLGMVLKANGLTEYDPFALLMVSKGYSSQDDFRLVEIDVDIVGEEQIDLRRKQTAATAFGAAVARARKERGLTQGDLAYRMGVDQPSISRLERGQTNPTLDLMQETAEALGMELKLGLQPKE